MKSNTLAVLVACANRQIAVDFGLMPSVGFSDVHPLSIDGYFDYLSLYLPTSTELIAEDTPVYHSTVKVACKSKHLVRKPSQRVRKTNKTKRGDKRTVANRREL